MNDSALSTPRPVDAGRCRIRTETTDASSFRASHRRFLDMLDQKRPSRFRTSEATLNGVLRLHQTGLSAAQVAIVRHAKSLSVPEFLQSLPTTEVANSVHFSLNVVDHARCDPHGAGNKAIAGVRYVTPHSSGALRSRTGRPRGFSDKRFRHAVLNRRGFAMHIIVLHEYIFQSVATSFGGSVQKQNWAP
ncbi:hypothetical protein L227DRAFT_386380 [Lentinus tigrinus ALCF2SS1-6]|uniref:Uncharacterized protein n=1 Tax=Lentinus tigrinus ALCF2SS1-6 TaxID=1328759 RepID=A0A5C2SHU5_9APHY|nr:hypothetical protein L227DRAFT_386380 [Lentinus tigrinus ALCF2SS1-6]